ncbi:hypothetical protein [Robiginitalea sp. IMCC43444]|uniref:hypothetical protein n=1 Tax=Robiginitalea sp. IMCC43444 TaxID=3459121 RepID=UPI00404132E3
MSHSKSDYKNQKKEFEYILKEVRKEKKEIRQLLNDYSDKNNSRKANCEVFIQQNESRIALVDTKVSIILASYGILLTSNEYLNGVLTLLDIPAEICYIILVLILLSVFFFLNTLRPPSINTSTWIIFVNHFFHAWRNNSRKFSDAWNRNNERHKINGLEELDTWLENLRVRKYYYNNLGMFFLKLSVSISILTLFIYLVKFHF